MTQKELKECLLKRKGKTLETQQNIPNTTKCKVEYALTFNHATYEGHEYATSGSLYIMNEKRNKSLSYATYAPTKLHVWYKYSHESY